MKHLTFLAFFGFYSQAIASPDSVFKQIHTIIENVRKFELEYYWIDSHLEEPELAILINENPLCKNPNNFENTSVNRLGKVLIGDIEEAYILLERQGQIENSNDISKRLKESSSIKRQMAKEFAKSKISVCKVKTMPPYSDGHEINFVKVNGLIMFAWEVGRPD